MKKRYVILMILGFVLIAGSLLCYHYRQQIGEKIVDSLKLRKGTAKWWSTHSSEESKERGVFVAYYDALPFEYEDSICHIKLVFNEVWVEWMHWYDYGDTAMEHCLYYENSETVKDQQLIGLYDTMQTIPGIAYILKENDHQLDEDDKYLFRGDTAMTYSQLLKVVDLNNGCCPVELWDVNLPVTGSSWKRFDMGRYEYAWGTTGVNKMGGEFGDTIRVPIVSSLLYDKRAGYDHKMKFPFGELVFVRRIEE